MSVKISELSASAQITSDDFLPIVDSGSLTTKRASASQILDYVTGSTFNSLTVTNLTASNISGTTAQFTIVTGSTITGSLAKFTTLSASTAEFSGSVLIYGTVSLSSNPSAAYIIYSSSMDKLVAFPGLFVSGNLTGSGLGSFQTVSASTYLGLPTSISGTTAQFTVISASLLSVTNGIFVSGSSIYGQVAELTSSTTSYTLLRQDSGKFLNINSVSARTVTVPTGLPTGFTVSLCQLNTGQVTISGAVGVTINNRQTHTKTAGQHAVVSLVGTSLNTYVFVGDTAT